MGFQIVPFSFVLLASALAPVLVVAVVWDWRDQPVGQALIGLSGAASWWSLTYAVGLSATTLGTKLISYKLMYVGVGVVPIAWLWLVLEISERDYEVRRPLAALLVAPLVVSWIVAWTNLGDLFWTGSQLVSRESAVVLLTSNGLGFWFFTAYAYIVVVIGAGILLQTAFSDRLSSGSATILFLAVLIPLGTNVLYQAGLTGFWDFTPIGFTFSSLNILGYLILSESQRPT